MLAYHDGTKDPRRTRTTLLYKKDDSCSSCALRAFVMSRPWPSVRKLFKKSQVVLVEQPDVLDLIFEDRDALDADAEGEAGVALRVVPDGLEHRGMDHAAAAELDPPGLFAHRAALAVALPAAQVDLGARLGVREEARAEADARRGRERLLREREQRALQIAERQPFADREAFDLAERGRVREIQIVAPVHASGHDDANRRLVRL